MENNQSLSIVQQQLRDEKIAQRKRKRDHLELLALKKPTAIDELRDSVPPPKNPLPCNGLPDWCDLRLDAKFPAVPAPDGTFITSCGELGENLFIKDSSSFDTNDPLILETPITYDPLHDPNLRNYFQTNPALCRRLVELGLLNCDGQVICTLAEFNKYRKYLGRIHNQQVLKEKERIESWDRREIETIKAIIRHGERALRAQLDKAREVRMEQQRRRIDAENYERKQRSIHHPSNFIKERRILEARIRKAKREAMRCTVMDRVRRLRESERRRARHLILEWICRDEFRNKLTRVDRLEKRINRQEDLCHFIEAKRAFQEQKRRQRQALIRRDKIEHACLKEQRSLKYTTKFEEDIQRQADARNRERERAARVRYLMEKYGRHWLALTRKYNSQPLHDSTWNIRNVLHSMVQYVKQESGVIDFTDFVSGLLKLKQKAIDPETKKVVDHILKILLNRALKEYKRRANACVADNILGDAGQGVCCDGEAFEPGDFDAPKVAPRVREKIKLLRPTYPCTGPCAEFGKKSDPSWPQGCTDELEWYRGQLCVRLANQLAEQIRRSGGCLARLEDRNRKVKCPLMCAGPKAGTCLPVKRARRRRRLKPFNMDKVCKDDFLHRPQSSQDKPAGKPKDLEASGMGPTKPRKKSGASSASGSEYQTDSEADALPIHPGPGVSKPLSAKPVAPSKVTKATGTPTSSKRTSQASTGTLQGSEKGTTTPKSKPGKDKTVGTAQQPSKGTTASAKPSKTDVPTTTDPSKDQGSGTAPPPVAESETETQPRPSVATDSERPETAVDGTDPDKIPGTESQVAPPDGQDKGTGLEPGKDASTSEKPETGDTTTESPVGEDKDAFAVPETKDVPTSPSRSKISRDSEASTERPRSIESLTSKPDTATQGSQPEEPKDATTQDRPSQKQQGQGPEEVPTRDRGTEQEGGVSTRSTESVSPPKRDSSTASEPPKGRGTDAQAVPSKDIATGGPRRSESSTQSRPSITDERSTSSEPPKETWTETPSTPVDDKGTDSELEPVPTYEKGTSDGSGASTPTQRKSADDTKPETGSGSEAVPTQDGSTTSEPKTETGTDSEAVPAQDMATISEPRKESGSDSIPVPVEDRGTSDEPRTSTGSDSLPVPVEDKGTADEPKPQSGTEPDYIPVDDKETSEEPRPETGTDAEPPPTDETGTSGEPTKDSGTESDKTPVEDKAVSEEPKEGQGTATEPLPVEDKGTGEEEPKSESSTQNEVPTTEQGEGPDEPTETGTDAEAPTPVEEAAVGPEVSDRGEAAEPGEAQVTSPPEKDSTASGGDQETQVIEPPGEDEGPQTQPDKKTSSDLVSTGDQTTERLPPCSEVAVGEPCDDTIDQGVGPGETKSQGVQPDTTSICDTDRICGPDPWDDEEVDSEDLSPVVSTNINTLLQEMQKCLIRKCIMESNPTLAEPLPECEPASEVDPCLSRRISEEIDCILAGYGTGSDCMEDFLLTPTDPRDNSRYLLARQLREFCLNLTPEEITAAEMQELYGPSTSSRAEPPPPPRPGKSVASRAMEAAGARPMPTDSESDLSRTTSDFIRQIVDQERSRLIQECSAGSGDEYHAVGTNTPDSKPNYTAIKSRYKSAEQTTQCLEQGAARLQAGPPLPDASSIQQCVHEKLEHIKRMLAEVKADLASIGVRASACTSEEILRRANDSESCKALLEKCFKKPKDKE